MKADFVFFRRQSLLYFFESISSQGASGLVRVSGNRDLVRHTALFLWETKFSCVLFEFRASRVD